VEAAGIPGGQAFLVIVILQHRGELISMDFAGRITRWPDAKRWMPEECVSVDADAIRSMLTFRHTYSALPRYAGGMKPILVLYATREGQTRRIAEHLVATARERGLAGGGSTSWAAAPLYIDFCAWFSTHSVSREA
jgi:hypothetical protein